MALLKLFLIFILLAEVKLSGADTLCTSISGTCQEDSLYCAGYYKSGLCSGGVTRRCCVPSGADSLCTSVSGTCQDDSLYCAGSYKSGLCSGGVTRRCCVPPAGCSNINIITRSQWGARAPTATTAITVPVQKFFIHHTETPACTSLTDCAARVRNIQAYHMDTNGWSDIGYSFLVGEDGNVYEGRGWSNVGAHTFGQNSVAFAASMIGSFTSRLPNAQALAGWSDIGYSFLVGEDGNVYEGRGWTHVGAHTQNYNSVAFAASMIGSFDSHIPNAQAVKGLIACGVQLGKIAGDYRLYGHRDGGQTSCPGDALYREIETWPHYSHTKP